MPSERRLSRRLGRANAPPGDPALAQGFVGVFRYSRRALELVWTTSRSLTIALGLLTLAAGALPAAIAWVGAQIVDAVVAAMATYQSGNTVDYRGVILLVVLEGALVAAQAGVQRGISLCWSLLRALLGHRVNVMILEKAQTLDLEQFEDSEFYDKLTRARRESSSRPLSLVMRTFGLGQNAVSLISYGALLIQFSEWFKDGRELSGGQWQKIALSRAFMRSHADILVLDEPTAAMDAAAEATVFEHFRRLTRDRIAILISHRFSTVRMADQIAVIQNGRIVEQGSHAALMELDGHYAHLFNLQAAGYR